MNHKDIDYSPLDPTERILLAQELWDSVIQHDAVPATTPAQRAEIERRIALADASEMPSYSWAEVKARLLKKRQ